MRLALAGFSVRLSLLFLLPLSFLSGGLLLLLLLVGLRAPLDALRHRVHVFFLLGRYLRLVSEGVQNEVLSMRHGC